MNLEFYLQGKGWWSGGGGVELEFVGCIIKGGETESDTELSGLSAWRNTDEALDSIFLASRWRAINGVVFLVLPLLSLDIPSVEGESLVKKSVVGFWSIVWVAKRCEASFLDWLGNAVTESRLISSLSCGLDVLLRVECTWPERSSKIKSMNFKY